jgi:integrase/recombinase XerD
MAMTLMPAVLELPVPSNLETYEQAASFKANLVWKKLDEISVEEAISYWLSTLSPKTQLSYRSGMKKLVEFGWLNPLISLQQFALINHEGIIDRIKLFQEWAETTRQARAACYISFTGFLSRRLEGVIKKAVPNKEGNAKTFFSVYEKVKTHAMTQAQWILFFKELEKINPRDCLIGKVILQGGKRVNEVLSLQTDQIDWDRCEITFIQSKMRRLKKETVITYSESIMKRLKDYIGERTGQVFITRSGNSVMINQVAVTFAKAGKAAGVPFKVSPHVLRASAVTYLKQQGFQDSDIMRVTGHSTAEMVYAYDKSSRADNASKKVNLIS